MNTILFLDNWMVDEQVCLERAWHRPQFVKEVLSDFYPGWLGYSARSVFRDERTGQYAMYVRALPPEADPGAFLVRLQTDDPYHWPHPRVDTATTPHWQGFADVVLNDLGDRQDGHVTPLAGTPLADRGYIVTYPERQKEPRRSMLGFSDDGLHFRIDWEHPWRDTRSDTWNGVVWNAHHGHYQIFTRPVLVDRRIAIVTTTDFQRMSPVMTVLQPDAADRPGTEFYGMPTQAYDDLYIGLLWVFSTDTFERRRIRMAGRMETQLVYSYNGVNWYRSDRRPFLGVREYGQLGGGAIYGVGLIREKDKLLVFASGNRGEHASYPDMQKAGIDTTGHIGPLLYEMRPDGFCSMKTWGKDGLLRTKTIVPQSGALTLNVRTTKHTAVRVQMVDAETYTPIPGYTLDEAIPITGDHLAASPRWKERQDIGELVGRPVQIEIAMREAELFAIRVPCQALIGREPTETL